MCLLSPLSNLIDSTNYTPILPILLLRHISQLLVNTLYFNHELLQLLYLPHFAHRSPRRHNNPSLGSLVNRPQLTTLVTPPIVHTKFETLEGIRSTCPMIWRSFALLSTALAHLALRTIFDRKKKHDCVRLIDQENTQDQRGH